jgi:hypothetical protein
MEVLSKKFLCFLNYISLFTKFILCMSLKVS